MKNETKEANNILAAAIYEPGLHGDKFNHHIARDIIQSHICNTKVDSNTQLADYAVYSKVKGDINIQDTKCMNIFNAKMSTLYSASNNGVSFQVIQERDGDEITYRYEVSFVNEE